MQYMCFKAFQAIKDVEQSYHVCPIYVSCYSGIVFSQDCNLMYDEVWLHIYVKRKLWSLISSSRRSLDGNLNFSSWAQGN